MVTTRQGLCFGAHSATQDGHYFTFVDHSGIATIHCEAELCTLVVVGQCAAHKVNGGSATILWSSRWCSKCVLLFRRAVDCVVVHACGDGAHPHSHGALG